MKLSSKDLAKTDATPSRAVILSSGSVRIPLE